MRIRMLAIMLAAVYAMLPVQAALGQNYPTRQIRFIVPFAPGGGNDILGRVIAQKLHEAFGVPVLVDNRGGAGGTIGTDITVKSPPDGYTMLINNVSLAVNVTLYSKLPYDTLKDLEPVTLVGRQPNILVVHPSLPVKSVKDLLVLARAQPGQLMFASGGTGSSSHLAGELFKLMTGIDMAHVPYKGMGPALIDLVSGQTQLCMATMASALPHIKNGRLHALAVSTAQRVPVVPDVPTMMEAGVSGFEYSTWYGLLVPARTPPTIIAKIHAEMIKILASADLKQKFGVQGVDPSPTSPEEFKGYLRSEVGKWAKVIKASGARVN